MRGGVGAFGVGRPMKTTKPKLDKSHGKPSPVVSSPHIRWMIRRDMPEVLAIENHSFPFPWSDEDFIRCLRQRNCIGMVVELDEQIVAFMVYELNRDNLRVLNFAVHEGFRRRGIGTAMVDKLMAKLSQQRRTRIELLIYECNLDGQLFFRQMGFEATRVVPVPFPDDDNEHDGYEMVRRIDDSEDWY
jgi:ribosomal-protein-alanine N-acetyltransferase